MFWKCFPVVLIISLTIFLSGPVLAQRNFRQEQAQLCFTPQRFYGICVTLTQCPSIVSYYGSSGGSAAAYNYLLQIQRACGTRSVRNDPVVCCEEAYNRVYGIQVQTTVRPTQPPTRATTIRPVNPFEPPTQPPKNPFSPPTLPPTMAPVTQPATQPPTRPTPPPIIETTTSLPVVFPNSCLGPDQQAGTCTDIRSCQPYLDFLVKGNGNPGVATFIRMSNEICQRRGFTQGNQICCGRQEPSLDGGNTGGNQVKGRELLNTGQCGLSVAFEFRRIVGGRPAKLNAWPWATLLGYDSLDGTFKCGGALITSRHVITAAHCIRSNLRFVRLGEHDLNSDTETRHMDVNVIKMDRHPQYSSKDGRNDIAVLHLANDVPFSTGIRPICLPLSNEAKTRSYVGYTPFVAGWGRTEEGGKSSPILLELQLPVLERTLCRQKYAAQNRIASENQFDQTVLCAGSLAGGNDTCQGDSGGPLMFPEQVGNEFKFTLIGVVSYGIGCARTDIPGVYANVPNFIDWIIEKVSS